MAPEKQAGDGDDPGAATPPEAKTFASGRYAVRRLLGQGAQKTVYLVHDTELDRECALSVIKTDLLGSEDLARLRREAQTMARLTHGNIVTVYDIGEEEGRPYIVSEYAPGGDLRRELREGGGPLPLHRAVAIARDLCRALAVAHGRGVVHRDLKPANIWLAEDGSAKLGDFGVAQAVDRSRLTMTGTVMGTPACMAPEQAQGGEVTARSDLYALGCVMYELLTGRPPFVADDPMAVVSQHVHATPTPPSEHNQDVPVALERLVLRLLEKAPEQRPASAEEVLAELERMEATLPETETARPARGLARLSARPAYQALLVALLLVVVGGVAVGFLMSRGGNSSVEYQEITYRYGSLEDDVPPPEVVSGDCEAEDMVLRSSEATGLITGDIDGHEIGMGGEIILFAATGCESGFRTNVSILRDSAGNELHITDAGPLSFTFSPDMESAFIVNPLVETVTGGSGIYEGATGTGTCSGQFSGALSTTPDNPGPAGRFSGEGECTLQVTTDSAARAGTPLIVSVALSPNQVATFGNSDVPTTVEVLVAYWNGGTKPLTGLSLRVPAPEGAEIVTAARIAEDQTAAEGDRIWALPDLPPQGEVKLFPFQLQFLSIEDRTFPLMVQIDGDAFDQPIRSEPVTIEVR